MSKAPPNVSAPPSSSTSPAASKEERMLDELENIFLQDGFRNVTVEELARRLHCSKRTLYQLAPSKEDLFLRIFDRYLSRFREEGAQNAKAARPEEAFIPYLQPAIEAARKLSATLIRDMAAYEPANAMWERHRDERMAGLRALVERCVDERIFRSTNPSLVAEVFAASLRRICEPKFLAASQLTYPEAVSELYGLLLNGLLHPESGQPQPEPPLQQVTITIQGPRSGKKSNLVGQLETVLERLKAGELAGRNHNDSFDYSFEYVAAASKSILPGAPVEPGGHAKRKLKP